MTYRIYLPPCYEQSRVYPTLYIFHGSAQDDSHWDQLGLDEAATELILSAMIPPVIIVMPDGGDIAQDSSGGSNSFEGVVIKELIPHIEETYCAWEEPSARAIGGLSRGGYWALEIAFRHPEIFGSVGAHSAALFDEAAGSELDPAVTGLTTDLGDLRIYMDVGENDYTRAPIQALHESLEKASKDHRWVLNEGNHQDAYWSDHVHDYLRWYTENWPIDRSLYPDCLLVSNDR
jgi:enterochelin esterase-like enzyme